MQAIEFILYVADQGKSCDFYKRLLAAEPSLNVVGMTEFDLASGVKLGLMPEEGIAKILGDHTPHPKFGGGIPRAELYLKVLKADGYVSRGLKAGAKLISELENRDWGDRVAYLLDPDGHVIAIAEEIQ